MANLTQEIREQKSPTQWLHHRTNSIVISSTKTEVMDSATQKEVRLNLKPKQKHNTAEFRFLYWVAYTRKYDPNVKEEQRRTCPLTDCQREIFSDEESMLKHVPFCSGLSKGLYECCECNTTAKISKIHESGCKGRPRKHSLTGLLGQVRRGFSRSPSPDLPHLTRRAAKKQSSEACQSMGQSYSQHIGSHEPRELSSESARYYELGTNPNYFSVDFIQQNYPSGLEVASNYEANNIFALEEQLFGSDALYIPMSLGRSHETPPAYSSEDHWVTEKQSMRDPDQVQAAHPIHMTLSSGHRDGNTVFRYENSNLALAELPDTPLPAELEGSSASGSFDSAVNVPQVAETAVATSTRLINDVQFSSHEVSCLQTAQLGTKPKSTIDSLLPMASYIVPPPSDSVGHTSQMQLCTDPKALLTSFYGSSRHWSSSAYNQQALGFSLNDIAYDNEAQSPRSHGDHQYHQAGIVSPVRGDTGSDPNMIISPVSSVSSSIDQLLLDSKNQAETIHTSIQHERLPQSGGTLFPSEPTQTDQSALDSQSILYPAAISSLAKYPPRPRNLEDTSASVSQQLLDHGTIDEEQAGENCDSLASRMLVRTLEPKPFQQEAYPKTCPKPSAAAPSDSLASIRRLDDEPAKHASNAVSSAPGVRERCICGYEPKPDGKERNKLSNLKRHQKTCKTHSPQTYGDRPFSCSFPGCNKAYPRSDGLAVHVRTKHGSLSDRKATSGYPFSKSPKIKDDHSLPSLSSSQQGLRRHGAIHLPDGAKRRAPSLSSQQDLLEDEVSHTAVPKRRRLIDQEAVEPYSWVCE